jgi:hypothetical protein
LAAIAKTLSRTRSLVRDRAEPHRDRRRVRESEDDVFGTHLPAVGCDLSMK